MTTQLTSVNDLPNIPAVYAMYGGQGKGLYVAYVGVAGKLKNRIIQHLVRQDSSVTTGTSAVVLNVEYITQVKWWTRPDFDQRHILEAAELVAFDALNPILRSRGAVSEQARQLYTDPQFLAQMQAVFSGEPVGFLVIRGLQEIFDKIAELEHRIESIERRLSH